MILNPKSELHVKKMLCVCQGHCGIIYFEFLNRNQTLSVGL